MGLISVDSKYMEKLLKGLKVNMTQIFQEDGSLLPVTIVSTGDEISKELENKSVELIGKSKGKGFAGGMKRWNFKGQEMTRGMSDGPRKPGSIGAQTPGRVLKGKKMAGHLGNKQVTVKGVKIVKIDENMKYVYVSGPVPGARHSAVIIRVL